MIAYYEEQVARGADIPVASKRANSCKPHVASEKSRERSLINSARVGKSGRGSVSKLRSLINTLLYQLILSLVLWPQLMLSNA